MEPIIRERTRVRKLSDYFNCLEYYSRSLGVTPNAMHQAIMKAKTHEEKINKRPNFVSWNDVEFQLSNNNEFFIVFEAEEPAHNMDDKIIISFLDIRIDFIVKDGKIKYDGREQKPKYVSDWGA